MSEILRLTNVSKRFERGSQDLHVLRDVNIDLNAGENVSILGIRGQGKSTLLRIAAGMELPDEGTVTLAGQDLAGLSDNDLSRLIRAQVSWAGTSGPGMRQRLIDYITWPLLVGRKGPDKRTVQRNARGALERVGAEACADQYWQDISDWERALVEIAHGIAGAPNLLLVDDITDTLGSRETDDFTALLRSISQDSNMAVLMTVSDGHATFSSDRILTLSGGRLTHSPQSPSGNIIDFPDIAARRDAQRGGMS
jgi:lipoprotein-releasing system ATP-binding protein